MRDGPQPVSMFFSDALARLQPAAYRSPVPSRRGHVIGAVRFFLAGRGRGAQCRRSHYRSDRGAGAAEPEAVLTFDKRHWRESREAYLKAMSGGNLDFRGGEADDRKQSAR